MNRCGAPRIRLAHRIGLIAALLCWFAPTVYSSTLSAAPSRSILAQSSDGPLTPIRQITSGEGDAKSVALSADGRVVAFDSLAKLVAQDDNTRRDLYIYNGANRQISLASRGNGVEEGDSTLASLSADGNFVAFQSSASNLVANDTNGDSDIFVYNLRTGSRVRISLSSKGDQANKGAVNPVISGNGRYIAFESAATSLVFGDGNAKKDIFVHDRMTGNLVRASLNNAGNGGTGDSSRATISSNGRYVAFESVADNLVPRDSNGRSDIFVRDMVAGRTARVSVSSDGAEGDSDSYDPAFSGDGRFITFQSRSTNLVAGANSTISKVFLHDRDFDADGVFDEPGGVETALVSRTAAGGEANGDSFNGTISADGRQIAFSSYAPNLTLNDQKGASDVFMYDRASRKVRRVSQAPGGADADGDSFEAALSADGQIAAFHSKAGNLIGNALGGSRNIFLVETPAWLVMLYLAGDDIPPSQQGQVGLSFYLGELRDRLQAANPNAALHLVVLFDGSAINDSALYYRLPRAQGLVRVAGQQLPGWFGGAPATGAAELDTGNPQTLQLFTQWARDTFFGSAYTMLSIVDHGGGWAPDQSDIGQPRGTGMVIGGSWSGIGFDASANGGVGSSISTLELREALSDQEPFDVVFLDACLMGMVEVAYEVQLQVNYLVAGTNQLWARLPYEAYLASTALTSSTTPVAFARSIVERYNSPAKLDEPFAIAALDMVKLPGLVTEIESLAVALRDSIAEASARVKVRGAYAQTLKFDYDSSFSLDPTDAFVDLGDFVAQLQRPEHAISAEVTANAQRVDAAVRRVVIARKRQSGKSPWASDFWNFERASGLSIYLPLGEKDCRATGLPIPVNGSPAEAPCQAPPGYSTDKFRIEPQLKYYARGDLLRFSARDGARTWAALLQSLDSDVPLRNASRPSFSSPFQGSPVLPPPRTTSIFLPLLRR